MFDFVFSLRTLLLIIGALIVAGIYLWGGQKNKRKTSIKYAPRRAQFQPTKRRSGSHGATSMSRNPDREPDRDREPEPEPKPALQLEPDIDPRIEISEAVIVAGEAPIEELPAITRDGENVAPARKRKRSEGQMELTFETEASRKATSDGNTEGSPEQEVIIALYVRPPRGHEFAGPAIVRSMNSVGLRFGDMDIFHHYGAGELRTELPLFSVANMVEPGYFDLDDVDGFATPGLALFLRLPGPLDGAVAFELFLNTAQRLAEALSGDLYGDPKKLLDGTAIDKMRQQAAPFVNAD